MIQIWRKCSHCNKQIEKDFYYSLSFHEPNGRTGIRSCYHTDCWEEIAGKEYTMHDKYPKIGVDPALVDETDASLRLRTRRELSCSPLHQQLDITTASGSNLDRLAGQFGIKRYKGKV